jgi:uncharacterized protein YkwD
MESFRSEVEMQKRPRRILKPIAGILLLLLAMMAFVTYASAQDEKEKALIELTNMAREEAGLKPLTWDPGLAAAARAHAEWMVKEGGAIAHRYGGEDDLPERAAKAGAHFSLIEENIAVADSGAHVHQGWMKSQAHHDNMLNPKIDHIGVALVPSHGLIYAVADYSIGVTAMSPEDVEKAVGKELTDKGVTLTGDPSAARTYCAQEDTSDKSTGPGMKPRFLMRWQSADITTLPPQLQQQLSSGVFKQGTVGACAPQGSGGSGPVFSGYRVAVLLY